MDMMNRDAEDDAFEVSSDSETVDSFSEEFEPVEPPNPTRKRRTRKKPAKRLNLMLPKQAQSRMGSKAGTEKAAGAAGAGPFAAMSMMT